MSHGSARVLLAAYLALVATLVGVAPASAHARLVSMSPADGSTLSVAPLEVVLTFDEPPRAGFSVVQVTGPEGKPVQTGAPTTKGPTVHQALAADLGPGAYAVAWKAVSDDGHPVSGRSTFTVEPASATPLTTATATDGTTADTGTGPTVSVPAPSANGSTTPPSATPGGTSPTSTGSRGALWLLALALVVIGVLGWVRALRGRHGTHGGDA